MSWKRTKAITLELPTEPSLMRWLLAGSIAAIMGVLLFILHASGMIKTLAVFNLWWLAFSPVIGWFFLFCLRGWLWGRVIDRHRFLQTEAEYGQKQWELWAGRYLAVLGSSILLPSGVTPRALVKGDAVKAPQFLSLTCHFDAKLASIAVLMELGLTGFQNAVAMLPASLPLIVTIISDCNSTDCESLFNKVWKNIYPDRSMPDSVSYCDELSYNWLEERLKRPVPDVDLILILQNHGTKRYSDALASLVLTSDDLAEKYKLPHAARILRPMPLDMTNFKADVQLFLETQTAARQTLDVFCDYGCWRAYFAELMTVSQLPLLGWTPEQIDVLEKYNGIAGTSSAWLLTALLSDITSVSQKPVLGLFTSKIDHFVSTITPGSEKQ